VNIITKVMPLISTKLSHEVSSPSSVILSTEEHRCLMKNLTSVHELIIFSVNYEPDVPFMSPENTLVVKGRDVRLYHTSLVLNWPDTSKKRAEILTNEFHKLLDAYLLNGEWYKDVINDDKNAPPSQHEFHYHFRPCY